MNIKNELGDFDVIAGCEIQQGDLYLAKRNAGWKLLQCREHDKENHIVFPESNEYCFDTHECYKVIECR